MTNTKKKARGKPFEKGNKASKGNGRPKTTEADKKLTRLTRTRFNTIVRKYLHCDKDELKQIANTKGTPVLDLMVISVMNKAIVNGDEKKMNWFLEQLFGKLQENKKVTVSGSIENKQSYDLSKLSDEELEQLSKIVSKSEGDEKES